MKVDLNNELSLSPTQMNVLKQQSCALDMSDR